MNRQPSIRYPAPWEANILACGTLLMLLVFTGILSAFFPIPVVLIVGQLLIIVPSLTLIVVRHLPLQATFRRYPVSASAIIRSVLIGLACWPVVAGTVTFLEKPLLLIGPYPPAPFPSNWVESVAFGLAYIVLAPLTEEPIAFPIALLLIWLFLRRNPISPTTLPPRDTAPQ